jgi:hypothetical protein
MKNILNKNLKVWHLLLLSMLFIIGQGVPAKAAPPFPVGDVIISSASSDSEMTIFDGGSTTDLTATFIVPNGRTATVVAFYNARVSVLKGWCVGSLRLDSPNGQALNPGEMPLSGYTDDTYDINGAISGIGPGSHTIYVVVQSFHEPDTDPDCVLTKRSLILLVRTQ